jgi:hypothetical protein
MMAKRLAGLSFANKALHSYWAGDLVNARRLVLQAQKTDPRWLYNRELLSILVETIVGSRVMRRARQVKGSVTTHAAHFPDDESAVLGIRRPGVPHKSMG